MKEEESDKAGQIKGQTLVPPVSGRISLKLRHSILVETQHPSDSAPA